MNFGRRTKKGNVLTHTKLSQRASTLGATMTDQRKIICSVLEVSDDHPDIEQLIGRVRCKNSKISLATVYRTIKALADLNLVRKHDFGDGRTRYEITSETHHDHLIDVESGHVIEFADPLLDKLKRKIADQYGYDLHGHRLELYGSPR